MTINPYLSFDGQCEAALQLYERCLGVKVVYLKRYSESSSVSQVPADWHNRIFHATFLLGDQTFGAADAPPGGYRVPQGFSLILDPASVIDAQRIFDGLSENGVVMMPLQETEWALRFGVFTDQFAIPWMVNCEARSEDFASQST